MVEVTLVKTCDIVDLHATKWSEFMYQQRQYIEGAQAIPTYRVYQLYDNVIIWEFFWWSDRNFQQIWTSPMEFLSLIFISFICEKYCLDEAVATGIDKQMVEEVLRFGNIVTSIPLAANWWSYCRFSILYIHVVWQNEWFCELFTLYCLSRHVSQ